MKRPDPGTAWPWFALAEADLAVARMILERADATDELFGLACFHGQQAAEKAMKGVLTGLDLPAPRSHDLTVIGQAVAGAVEVPREVVLACEALADYGVGPRYPLPGRSVSREMATRARRDAELVCDWSSALVNG